MSSSLLDQHLYVISNIKLSAPSTSSKLLKDTFQIEILDGDKNLLNSAEGKLCKDQVIWDQEISLDVTAESRINLRVLREKKVIGEQATTVSRLLDTEESSKSRICTITLENGSELSFSIKEDRAEEVLKEGKELLSGIRFEGGESWSTFMAYFRLVKTAADPISGLNSHAHQAWSILSAIPEIIQTHFTRNSNLKKLLQRLMDIYKYIADANQLITLTTSQIQNFKFLLQQTSECSYFIKDYVDKNIAGKFWKGPIVDNKISAFNEVFDRLFDAIQNSIILQTSIVTLRVSETLECVSKSISETNDAHFLGEIPYAQNAGFVDGKKCLPGTRQKLINEILEWVNNGDMSKRVLVLSGQAGMGKSAVAHTIAEIFRTQNRLGSLFCFNRSDKDRVNFIFSTISRDLADGDALWRQNLIRTIQPTAVRKSLDPVTQFNEMIAKPSKDIGTIGPVVIVIDALDESGDRTERRTLLNLLFERSTELPPNYHLIITSRPEPDIEEQYKHPNVFCKHIADVDLNDTLHDIQQFVSHKLSTTSKILDERLNTNWHSELAGKAQGLFQWAHLACSYINPTVKIGLVERAKTVITRMSSSLYEFYHQILDALPEFQVEGFFAMFQTIIGAIIVSRKPLSISALQALFGPGIKDVTVKDILEPFHSLFMGVDNCTAEIRPLHTSLFDFFLSREQKPGAPNRYYIDVSDQSSIAYACLRVMNGMLRFNICNLETSHEPDRDVPNFNSRLGEAIPLHLSYACCYWAYHLEYTRLSSDILEEIRYLMNENLLHLFEVLSLLGEIEHGRVGMRILEEQVKDEYKGLAAQAVDAWRFAVKFGDMMMTSTPHLYISALPLTPKHSFISKQYFSRFPQLLSVGDAQSPDLRIQSDSFVKIHSATPESLAFSPQGRLIAASFDNGDFRVWDHVTGKDIYQWAFQKDGDGLFRVEFSQSGDLVYCYFRSGDVKIWNAKTSAFDEFRVEGFRGERRCADAVSSDGRYIVFKTQSDGNDTTLYDLVLHDTVTQLTYYLLQKRQLGYFGRMMFSPKGRFFGFAGIIRSYLWDTRTQRFVSFFTSAEWLFMALTDNHLFAHIFGLGSFVGVWDIQTCTKVRQVELGVSGRLNVFPNEKYLLHREGSTWSIWDIWTEDLIVRRSHESNICASAISPDSKDIALGSDDGRTHIVAWDMLAREKVEDGIFNNPSGESGAMLPISGRHNVWLKGRYLLCRTSHPTFIAISPEDNHWSVAYIGGSGGLFLWNIDEKEEFVLNPSRDITSFAFSAAGDRLIDGDSKGNINIWDVRTRQLTSASRRLIPNLKRIDGLVFSPMGTTFFVVYRTLDGSIRNNEGALIEELECRSRRIVREPLQYDLPIESISVASDNTHIYVYFHRDALVISDIVHRIGILDISTGVGKAFDMQMAPRFSQNGKYVAWVPKKDREKLVLWDLETRVLLNELSFNADVTTFDFSVDSKRVNILFCTIGSRDHAVVWDIQAARTTVTPAFSFNHSTRIFGSSLVSREDNFLLLHHDKIGRFWNLRVYEIMACFYDDHENNSHFGMLPRPLDDLETARLREDCGSSSEDAETVEYALVVWNKASFSLSTEIDFDGWVKGSHGELLFWIPEEMRERVWYPCMTYMTHNNPIKFNFNTFVHGTRWTECRMQPKS